MTRLDDAYERLNDEQKDAVDWPTDTVVLAGPGSGKTDTLAVKACTLLSNTVRPPQGVACITYTRAAAREINGRVAGLGFRPGRRLFAGTLHEFCLRIVLRPFADMVGQSWLRDAEVAAPGTRLSLLEDAMATSGLNQDAKYWGATLQRIRRTIASGEDPEEHFDRWQIETATIYDQRLADAELVDYDSIVHRAVAFIEHYPRVADILASAFPWLLIDEYQDLGGPLHRLVVLLRARGGVNVFAVGDADQTIMQFTGADPRYLNSLDGLGFHEVRLRINYRSGARLIRAASAVLGHDRGYVADPERTDEGKISLHDVPGGVLAQARYIADTLIPALTLAGTAPEEIAILYPRKSAALDELFAALNAAGVPHSAERDIRFPAGEMTPVVEWLQYCAQYAIGAPATPPIRFRDLSDELHSYLMDAGRTEADSALGSAMLLYPAIDNHPGREDLLLDWLTATIEVLDLREVLLAAAIYPDDVEAIDSLQTRLRGELAGTALGDFVGPLRQPGRVVVTTYHSCKGRQFDVVILPFLQQTFMPGYRWDFRARKLVPMDAKVERLTFYVAFTRARHEVALVSSESSLIGTNGRPGSHPRSEYIAEIQAVL